MGCSSLVVATTEVCDCEDNLDLDAAAGAAGEALYGAFAAVENSILRLLCCEMDAREWFGIYRTLTSELGTFGLGTISAGKAQSGIQTNNNCLIIY